MMTCLTACLTTRLRLQHCTYLTEDPWITMRSLSRLNSLFTDSSSPTIDTTSESSLFFVADVNEE